MATGAFGIGSATRTDDGTILEVWFPHVEVVDGNPPKLGGAPLAIGTSPLPEATSDEGFESVLRAVRGRPVMPTIPGTTRTAVVTRIDDLDEAPTDAADVYLRLHLLSHRHVAPHGANLDGAFALLANVAWTDLGPVHAESVEDVRRELAGAGRTLRVTSVDKFPRMTDYVVPANVRIADADRVRLGAHLAAGTTVMHEGFVNFNAGTLGASMIEGRISAGVVVGDGSDLGGGASIMGTLSGGGSEVISVGRDCLIGANAGIGISLGDRCIVEAGLYVTAGTKVTVEGHVVTARELSGRDGLLFRRDSQTGAVIALRRDDADAWKGLNADLHAHN
ncbi:MAG: DapH/DapD/GlmU-related protein [Nitriliruptoraceae bacterium]